MGPDIRIEVTGLRELVRDLRAAGEKDLAKALRVANKTSAEAVVVEALPDVPTLSGRLKGSVRALASQADGRAVAGKASVPYAAAIHWGTGPRQGLRGPHNIGGRPFLYDALQKLRAEGNLEERYMTELDKILDAFRPGR